MYKYIPHKLAVSIMKAVQKSNLLSSIVRLSFKKDVQGLEKELFGLKFSNPIGAAAGIDNNGEIYNCLGNIGFSFVEIGSITPKPQSPSISVHRNSRDKSILHPNYSSNKGIRQVIRNIQDNQPSKVILAANLAPQVTNTKDEETIKDYQTSFSLLFDFVDMYVINVSCTNLDGMDPIQELSDFREIMEPLLDLRLCYGQEKPILIKISPDTPHSHLDVILDYCMYSGIDGIVAGNASKARGGLSGAPIYEKSLELVKYISNHTKGRLPIIGCGGITTPKQVEEMLENGASLVEVHTALVFEGPSFVKNTISYLTRPR